MEETRVLEINLISAQGLKEPTGKLRRLQTYASVWVDSSNKLRTRIDRIGAENPIWNDKFVFQVSPDFLSSETSGVSIEIYAVGYLRDHLIGTVRFLVSNFLPTAAVKVPSLVALQIRHRLKPSIRPTRKNKIIIFYKNLGIYLSTHTLSSSSIFSVLCLSPYQKLQLVKHRQFRLFFIMAKFTREITGMEVRATEENRIRYSSKQIKHLPPGTITEFDWKDYCPLGFRLIQELEDIEHDDYMHSICNDETLNKLSSGKIGNVFHISNDDRFLIKILRKSEIKVVLDMLPGYYRHLNNYRSSLFTRIYGLHAVKPIGGVKTYFAVMSNMLHSTVLMNKLYDLKGSPKGRTNKKIEVRNTTVLKDSDLDFCFYVNPLARQRIIKQTKLDCELLEEQGIMDYSLLVGLQSKGSCEGSLDGVDPVYGSFTPPCSFKSDSTKSMKTAANSPDRTSETMYSSSPDKDDSVESEKSVTSNGTSSETIQINRKSKLGATLNDLFLNSSSINFGMKIPARARRVNGETGEEEWYDVVLYLGIVDTFQDYGMKKRIEHCYKSIQHNSNSISTVNPKIYSSRFQDFVSNIFLPHDDDLSL